VGGWWWCKVIIISNPTAVEVALSCIEVVVGVLTKILGQNSFGEKFSAQKYLNCSA